MTRRLGPLAPLGPLLLAGCSFFPTPTSTLPTIPPGARVICGALIDEALCRTAVQVALTAQLNPPPIAEARVRRPEVGDDCLTAARPCNASSVIVVLQSGDTLQEVPLIRTGEGWARLDQVR